MLIATIVVIVGASLLFNKPQGTPTSLVDQDTGETYDANVNNTNTGGGSFGTDVHLFGIEKLIVTLSENGYKNSDFVSTIKQALTAYSSSRLENRFTSLTFRPQNLTINKTSIDGEIRLGETNEIVPIHITPSQTNAVAVVTVNKNKPSYGGAFIYVGGLDTSTQSGNLQSVVSQIDDHSTDLLISTYSNRESGLQYLEKLGYNIPDFSIKFNNNYENPFK